jgi:hypothetical protein
VCERKKKNFWTSISISIFTQYIIYKERGREREKEKEREREKEKEKEREQESKRGK